MSDPSSEVRPLHLAVPERELQELRDRLRLTRLPHPETIATPDGRLDWSQGPPLSYVAELVGYWAETYSWRAVEGRLNAAGQALTGIDGLDIHLLHVRSERADAQPLVITHGWPSSVLEPLQVMADLAAPASPDDPAFHVVAPSLPGFGFSGKPDRTGWTVERTADAWAELMARLGYEHFLAAGGDWGGRVTTALARRHGARVRGIHTFTPYVPEPADGDGEIAPAEAGWAEGTRRFWREGGGYSLEHSTRPQTVAYALVDSPVGLLTWILDKFHAWTDSGDNPEEAIDRDAMLDTITLYWLTATGGTSAQFYRENYPVDAAQTVPGPAAVTVFPADIEKFPRSWVEPWYEDLRSWELGERGGHFPMLEVPGAYAAGLRRAFAAMLS